MKREKRTERLAILATKSEMRLLKRAARDRGQTLSGYLRLCSLLYANSRSNEATDMGLAKKPASGPQVAA